MTEERKLAKSITDIPGTILNHQNNQLLISSGIPSLDELLGGGFPVGTLILVEEDQTGTYAKVMTKYFLAEGVVCNQSAFVASLDMSTEKIVRELPSVVEVDPEPIHTLPSSSEEMKIAFRYSYLPTTNKPRDLNFGHHFDLSNSMSSDILQKADISHWKIKDDTEGPHTFSNPAYYDLLQGIHNKIKDGKFSLSDASTNRSVLRIALNTLGSPMWLGVQNVGTSNLGKANDLNMFIYCLRAIVRSAFAVALITIPSHLVDRESIDRCIHSSDIVFRLQAFSGTNLENNPILSEYHGYFHIVKFAAINSFVSKHPGSVEYIFKLRRKKFFIEKLHLPPDLQALETTHAPTMGCFSKDKHLLEF